MTSLRPLFRLQQLDTRMSVCANQLKTLAPAEELARKIRVREHKLKDLTEKLHGVKIALKDAELKLASHASHRKSIEKKLYDGSTTNSKELAGFSKEAEILKTQEGDLETKVLELMEAVDASAEELAALNGRLEKSRKAWEEEQVRLEESRHEMQRQLEEMKQKREAQAKELDPILLARYEALRTRKQGVAVARMTGNACGECGQSLPDSVRRHVLDWQLELCSNCERILFAEQEA